jgi:hypothetical protein
VRQKLFRRLEDLEKLSAEAAARREPKNGDYERKMAEIMEQVNAWHADPVNQTWLAEQPPEYLFVQVQTLRQELMERACGNQPGA